MYNYHKDAQGNKMLIASMEDSNLTNFIKMVFGKIKTCKEILNSEISVDDKFLSALVDYDIEDLIEDAEMKVKQHTERLYPYLAEAMLRGISFTTEMQSIYDRNGSLNSGQTRNLELDFLG